MMRKKIVAAKGLYACPTGVSQLITASNAGS